MSVYSRPQGGVMLTGLTVQDVQRPRTRCFTERCRQQVVASGVVHRTQTTGHQCQTVAGFQTLCWTTIPHWKVMQAQPCAECHLLVLRSSPDVVSITWAVKHTWAPSVCLIHHVHTLPWAVQVPGDQNESFLWTLSCLVAEALLCNV